MRAVRFHEHGGVDVLQVDDVERPGPADDEVVVSVEAAGVNPVDTYFREGSYPPGELPWIPGSDAAGDVVAVGDAVDEFAVGDRVFATGLGNDVPGTYAEFVAAPVDRVARLPSRVSYAEGAGAGVAGVTAWRALVDHADLDPAETCLVHGGSGGVGHVAVQVATAAGARVVTTAAPEYHGDLADLGADAVLDYASDTLAEDVQAIGSPDVILDHRLDEYLDFDADVARVGTRLVGIGNTVPEAGWDDVAAARGKDLQVTLMSMFNTPRLADPMADVAHLMATGDVDVRVAETYDLDEAAEAQRAVLADSFLGKLVVEP